MKNIVQFARPIINKSLKEAGFVLEDVVLRWNDIVGEDLAPFTLPIKITWAKKRIEGEAQQPGVLHLRVESAVILEVQHQKNLIIERVNRYFGWNAITQIKTTQGMVLKKMPVITPKPSLIAQRRVAKIVGDFDDENLKNALLSLGGHIYARNKI